MLVQRNCGSKVMFGKIGVNTFFKIMGVKKQAFNFLLIYKLYFFSLLVEKPCYNFEVYPKTYFFLQMLYRTLFFSKNLPYKSTLRFFEKGEGEDVTGPQNVHKMANF